jgi:hypothetical protein
MRRDVTYSEPNRGLISGIEKIEDGGEKYELAPLEYAEPLKLLD